MKKVEEVKTVHLQLDDFEQQVLKMQMLFDVRLKEMAEE